MSVRKCEPGIGPRRDASIPLSISRPPSSTVASPSTSPLAPSPVSTRPTYLPHLYTAPPPTHTIRGYVQRLTMIQIPEIHFHFHISRARARARAWVSGWVGITCYTRPPFHPSFPTCSCVSTRRCVYPRRRCNTARYHFNEDVITPVSAPESATRPSRATTHRLALLAALLTSVHHPGPVVGFEGDKGEREREEGNWFDSKWRRVDGLRRLGTMME